jgi:hypothetical protein
MVKAVFTLLQVVWLWALLLDLPAVACTSTSSKTKDNGTSVAQNDDNGGGDNTQTCGTATKTSPPESACHSKFSQTSLAVAMSQQSSPRGSPSHVKLQRILARHRRFYLDLGGDHHQGLFDAVADNMIAALGGYGLVKATDRDDRTLDTGMLRVEALFSPHRPVPNDNTSPPFLQQPHTAIIVLQTEQICCTTYGQRMLPYMQLCHASPNCILWEYSQRNWEWLKEQGLGDSVMLLPILHQHRLNHYYDTDHDSSSSSSRNQKMDAVAQASTEAEQFQHDQPKKLAPLNQRPIDVVFFGVMTPRRKQLQEKLETIAKQQHWNLVLEEVANSGSRLDYMANSYRNAKICLIIHSFFTAGGGNPGEYHRLSELAPSGCVPVVEAFGDVLMVDGENNNAMGDFYGRCGGVLFADLQELVGTLQAVLYSIYHGNDRLQELLGPSMPELAAKVDALNSMEDRMAWWNDVVQWESVLKLILDETDNDEEVPPLLKSG